MQFRQGEIVEFDFNPAIGSEPRHRDGIHQLAQIVVKV